LEENTYHQDEVKETVSKYYPKLQPANAIFGTINDDIYQSVRVNETHSFRIKS